MYFYGFYSLCLHQGDKLKNGGGGEVEQTQQKHKVQK